MFTTKYRMNELDCIRYDWRNTWVYVLRFAIRAVRAAEYICYFLAPSVASILTGSDMALISVDMPWKVRGPDLLYSISEIIVDTSLDKYLNLRQ